MSLRAERSNPRVAGVPPARVEDILSSIRRRDAFDTRGQDARDTGDCFVAHGAERRCASGLAMTYSGSFCQRLQGFPHQKAWAKGRKT
jgi:hypothetical protein